MFFVVVCSGSKDSLGGFEHFLSKDSFAKSKMKMIDFSLFRKTAVFYSQKKMEAKKNVSKHVDNHLFCSFCDYILDLCDELCLARTRRESSFF